MFDHTFDVIKPDNINDATQNETCSSEQGYASPVSDGKPAPEVVRVFGPMPVWPLVPRT